MATEQTTYEGWILASKRIAKQLNSEAIVVTGDKDIGEVFMYRTLDGKGCVRLFGEWDGVTGTHLPSCGPCVYEGDSLYGKITEFGKRFTL